jgi:phage terminase small subunit
MEKRDLTTKQAKFLKEYIKTGNGTQSAIKAGYSEKTAKIIASQNLTKLNIKTEIEKHMSKEAEKMGINAEYVLGILKKHAEDEVDKRASLKGAELLGKHLKLFHDGEVDLRVSQHRETIKALEELE